MTPETWQRINEVFHAALAVAPDKRDSLLRQAAGGDPEILREVRALLESHERTAGFLDEPAWGIAADLVLDPPDPSLTGRQIGPYLVGPEIGRGGMGVVYAATDQRLGRAVALKALTPEYTRDRVRRERLTREARAAAALTHPAVATVFALEELDEALYIASELVEGRTLREEIADGPLPPPRLMATLLDIADALAAAHSRGIVHRDLKPENVMRRHDGQIKILDFGLASTAASSDAPSVTRLTEAGTALGTPGYMAPEQFGGGEVDATADVFAFGVLAWELATGTHPFGKDQGDAVARMAGALEGVTEPPSAALPVDGLSLILRRCLRALPAERYASGRPLAIDLRTLGGPGASQRAAGPAPTLWWWQCHQLVVSGLNAAMAAAAWGIRSWMPRPYGSAVFLMMLMLATISITLRLNLWFVSRVHPSVLGVQRARAFPALAIADGLLASFLVAAAALISGTHDEVAALLAVVGIATFASLLLIEPATTSIAGIGRGASDSQAG